MCYTCLYIYICIFSFNIICIFHILCTSNLFGIPNISTGSVGVPVFVFVNSAGDGNKFKGCLIPPLVFLNILTFGKHHLFKLVKFWLKRLQHQCLLEILPLMANELITDILFTGFYTSQVVSWISSINSSFHLTHLKTNMTMKKTTV